MNDEKKPNYEAFELAYGNGRIKKWTLEKLIIDLLYKTDNQSIIYLKTNDINCFGTPDEENEDEMIYKYGYLFRSPKTEIDLVLNKKDGKLLIKKVGIGWGYDNVEQELYKDILNQIKNKKIYFHTNFNDEEYLIKQ